MTGISLVGMLAMGKYCRGKRILAVHFHHEGVKPIFVWKIMYIIACKKFDRITFASNFIRDEAIKIYSNVKNKSEVINNPIQKKEQQTHENRIQSRKRFKLSNDDIVFGNAGWLIKRKRFDVFIKLAREIKNNHPNSKFLIAGDGIEKNNLMDLAEKAESSRFYNLAWLARKSRRLLQFPRFHDFQLRLGCCWSFAFRIHTQRSIYHSICKKWRYKRNLKR